ncbi:MAG TPA: response regulator transcription factor [Chthonomonadaceae bacterium]|nr:response regulator transcription factor [Chthonomonadaceae bacterium]
MNANKILVVEDDPRMQKLLRSQLEMRGYPVEVVDDGPAALTAVADSEPSLVLLDIGLATLDGLEVCRELREWSAVPIILVTATDAPEAKIKGLEYGADDYLTKPFHMGELVARIRAVLRRVYAERVSAPPVMEVDGLRIDAQRREVRRQDELLHLTKTEFDLLWELVSHAGKVLTYDYLLNVIWGGGATDTRPIHVHICNLRRKLEQGPTSPRHILAVPGIGYRFRLSDLTP